MTTLFKLQCLRFFVRVAKMILWRMITPEEIIRERDRLDAGEIISEGNRLVMDLDDLIERDKG